MFCLDSSASMMSNDTGTRFNRFETCVQCVQRMLRDQVSDSDMVGILTFGHKVQTVARPVQKGHDKRLLETRIASLRPDTAGGTQFYDAVQIGLNLLEGEKASRWLICLTDGDDIGSVRENARGQLVTKMLQAGQPANLSMIVITVGAMKDENLRIIGSWAELVTANGGCGRHLPERDAGAIGEAFQVVAEILAEVGGATEC